MAINVDKILATLSKLYDKRAALDKSILTAQKALATAVGETAKLPKAATKKVASAKKAVSKKASPKA
jgi:hypothetical protein